MKIIESSSIFDKRQYYTITAHTSYLTVSPYVIRQKYRTTRRPPSHKVSEQKRNSHLLQLGKSARWKTFITLTFDDQHYSHCDYENIQAQFRYLFNKLLPRHLHRSIKYLAVLEHGTRHGRAHYHVLTDIDFDESIFKRYLHFSRKVLPLWKGGYSDVARLDESDKCIYYLMKYLGKTGIRTPVGKREIFTSRKLSQTIKLVLNVKQTLSLLKKLDATELFDALGYKIFISDKIPDILWHKHLESDIQQLLLFN